MSAHRGPDRPGQEYLHRVLDLLWPAHTLRSVGRWARLRPAPAGSVDVVVLPSEHQPRLVLPRGHRAAASAAATAALPGGSPARRVLRVGVRLAVATRVADLLGSVVRLTPVPGGYGSDTAAAPLVDVLGRHLGEQVSAALGIGPVRAVQKPVLELRRGDGAVVGYAKVGVDAASRGLVEHETLVLQGLAREAHQWLRTPRVLWAGRWSDCPVLVQEPLVSDGPMRPEVLVAATLEAATAGGSTTVGLGESPFWTRLRTHLVELGALRDERVETFLPHLVTAADAVEHRYADRRVRFGRSHGDWAPWNMAAVGDRAGVWDWESATIDGPVGLDALHHRVQDLVVVRQQEPLPVLQQVAGEATDLLEPFGVGAETARLLVLLYVLNLATEYLRTGEAGTRLARLDTWLPAVLDGLVEQATRDRALGAA